MIRLVSKMTAVKASVTPAECDAGDVDQHIDLAGLHEYLLDARFDRRVGHSQDNNLARAGG